MYISINFNPSNIYLYQKYSGPIICKNNFAYKLTNNESYNKIIGIITDMSHRDIVQIFNNDKISININTIWGLKKITNTSNNIKRNILIPDIINLSLTDNHIDLNSINCLCHDYTHIINIPDITVSICNIEHTFTEWTGNNQVWCSVLEYNSTYLFAYLYIFAESSVLLISQTDKDLDNQYLDLDLQSIYNHTNLIQDEYNRFDCSSYKPVFDKITILNNPLNRPILKEQIIIKTHDLLFN